MGARLIEGGKWKDPALIVAVWLGGALVFFREQWSSGFSRLMGNGGDSRLIAYLCEHWFRVFHGQDSWLNPGFFYPVKHLLGWSDTFLLYEVFYAPLRLMGLDPFEALQVTVILLSFVGFATFVTLVRRFFGAPVPVALVLGLVFTFSNALWLHAGAFQDNAIYLVPLLLLLALGAYRAAEGGRRPRAIWLGAALGVFFALLIMTAYYTAYFTTLSAAIVILVALAAGGRRIARQVLDRIRAHWLPLGAAAAGFGMAMVPVLITYIPARSEAQGSTYAQIMGYAGRLHDLVNVGAGNTLWGSLVGHMGAVTRSSGYEQTYATTPILMAAALLGAAACLRWTVAGRASRPLAARAAVVLGIATVIVALLPIHTPLGTPWSLVYHLPGASAMRAIERIQIAATLLATLTLAAAATEVSARQIAIDRLGPRLAGVALLALVVVEQLNTTPSSLLSHKVQANLLRSASRAPASCRSFYLVDSAHRDIPGILYQLDAMLVAQRVGVATINGYTGYNPKGWGLDEPGSLGYPDAVFSWAQLKGISGGLCQFDLATGRWGSAQLLAQS